MNATLSPFPTTVTPPSPPHANSCIRCGGIMVNEQCIDLAGSEGGYRFWASRCVQCGDLIDPVILRNRLIHTQTLQEIERAA